MTLRKVTFKKTYWGLKKKRHVGEMSSLASYTSFSGVFPGCVDMQWQQQDYEHCGKRKPERHGIFFFFCQCIENYQSKVYHFLLDDASLSITSVLSLLELFHILIIGFYNRIQSYRMNFTLLLAERVNERKKT